VAVAVGVAEAAAMEALAVVEPALLTVALADGVADADGEADGEKEAPAASLLMIMRHGEAVAP
jgi:hypothetical protein